jgi:hypothetical protein
MLQRLIVGRLTLTPDVATGAYAFEGRGSYSALFQGESLSLTGVSPGGFAGWWHPISDGASLHFAIHGIARVA